MLTLLSQRQDTARIDAVLADLTAAGVYGKADNEAVVQATSLLPPARAAELIERIIAGNAATHLSACGDLLARCAAVAQGAGRTADLLPAAVTLIDALPGDPAKGPKLEPWRSPPAVEPGFVIALMTALGRLDGALAEQAAGHMLAWPKTYGLDAVLVPAVLKLTGQAETRDLPAVQRLRAVCLEHLSTRIAKPLEPPRDWKRASLIACSCPNCKELSRFLADPKRESWAFKAAEADRGHVAGSVQQAKSDLDLTTERRGRPYTLVCTKNQASYDRLAQQRRQDLEYQARLEAPAG